MMNEKSFYHAELRIPSLTSAFFDRTNHISLWGYRKQIDDAFYKATMDGFCGYRALSRMGIRLFGIRQRMRFNPEYHILMKTIIDTPLNVVMDFYYTLDKKSCDIVVKLYYEKTGKLLATEDWKSSFVEWETKTTVLPPEWFIKAYSDIKRDNDDHYILERQEVLTPPDNAFATTIKTRCSDTDVNKHVNVCEYFRFCSDCGTEASLSGYYRHFTSDLSWYPVAEFDVTYLDECPPCEMITLSTWQDRVDVSKIYFTIHCKEKHIFQAAAIYHKDKSENSVVSKM